MDEAISYQGNHSPQHLVQTFTRQVKITEALFTRRPPQQWPLSCDVTRRVHIVGGTLSIRSLVTRNVTTAPRSDAVRVRNYSAYVVCQRIRLIFSGLIRLRHCVDEGVCIQLLYGLACGVVRRHLMSTWLVSPRYNTYTTTMPGTHCAPECTTINRLASY